MKKTFQIDGMHCVSCEILLQQACTACKGCTVERVDHKKGLLHVALSDERAEYAVRKAVAGCGYRIVEENNSFEGSKKKTVDERIQTIALFAMIALIVWAVSKTEVMQYIPNIGDDVSVGIALLVGVIASVSTCLAVT